MNREYVALVHGIINENKGKINAPIGRDLKNRIKMAVCKDGKDAITHFEVLERFKAYTLVYCKLETGRTHQIRVSFAHINHPLTNDPLYNTNAKSNNMKLIACSLKFIHPITKKKINVSL